MKTKYIYIILIFSLLILPSVSFAALGGLRGLLVSSVDLMNLTIRILFGLAVAYFFWGMIQFIAKSGEERARTEGRKKMLWGIIALFVMASIYGILALVGSTLGINTGFNPTGSSGINNSIDCNVIDGMHPSCL